MQNFIKAMNAAYEKGNRSFEPAIRSVCEKARLYEKVDRIEPLNIIEQDDLVK